MAQFKNTDLWPHGDVSPRFDARDREIRTERAALLDAVEGPRVGDWVEFADETRRRISHLWPDGAQTSNGGSFYLGEGHVSFSGSLFRSVPLDSLTRTDRSAMGDVWFFHHEFAAGHNGVHTAIPFRVYSCPLPAPKS